jgi:hypothetical protein
MSVDADKQRLLEEFSEFKDRLQRAGAASGEPPPARTPMRPVRADAAAGGPVAQPHGAPPRRPGEGPQTDQRHFLARPSGQRRVEPDLATAAEPPAFMQRPGPERPLPERPRESAAAAPHPGAAAAKEKPRWLLRSIAGALVLGLVAGVTGLVLTNRATESDNPLGGLPAAESSPPDAAPEAEVKSEAPSESAKDEATDAAEGESAKDMTQQAAPAPTAPPPAKAATPAAPAAAALPAAAPAPAPAARAAVPAPAAAAPPASEQAVAPAPAKPKPVASKPAAAKPAAPKPAHAAQAKPPSPKPVAAKPAPAKPAAASAPAPVVQEQAAAPAPPPPPAPAAEPFSYVKGAVNSVTGAISNIGRTVGVSR